jgi:hypothetical protein
MTIDNVGSVGIGTATPGNPLEVYHATTNTVTNFKSGDTLTQISIEDTSDMAYFGTQNNLAYFGLSSGASINNVIVNTSGYVGIGTANPSTNLHVEGDAIFTGTVTAQEFHAEFVSSSIIYESGSTKFGNSNDDIHAFTGSMGLTVTSSAASSIFNIVNDNSEYLRLASIRSAAGTGPNDQLIQFSENLRFTYAPNEPTPMVFFSGSGHVGIGTTGPSSLLHLYGTGQPKLTIQQSDDVSGGATIALTSYDGTLTMAHYNDAYAQVATYAGKSVLQSSDNLVLSAFNSNQSIEFYAGNRTTPKMYIAGSTGYVGIGTTTIDELLHVGGTGVAEDHYIKIQSTGGQKTGIKFVGGTMGV